MPEAKALAGLRVLDLSRVLAGPWSTQMLADFGADVIKVEKPLVGDDSRGWGPPFYEGADGERVSAYFCATNRGKRSVALDLTNSSDVETIRRLANEADVLVENFKVGTLSRHQLDYGSLSATNPALVYCSITGFGQTGPYAARPGYDTIVQGMGGLMSVTGRPDGTPGEGPMKTGAPVADVLTGVYAFAGILLALRERDRSGRGQQIDLSLLDVSVTALSVVAANYLASGQVPSRQGNELPNAVPSDALRCLDGHVMIMVGTDLQFKSLCACVGLPALPSDPRFASNERRVQARSELMGILRPLFELRTRAEWIVTLSNAGVPCGPINDLKDVFEDQHVKSRENVVALSNAVFSNMRVLANPLRLSRTSASYEPPPTRLGGDVADFQVSLDQNQRPAQ